MSSELRRYEDLYDRQAVKMCLSIERFMDRSLADIFITDPKKAVKTMTTESARRISIYYTAGERAKR